RRTYSARIRATSTPGSSSNAAFPQSILIVTFTLSASVVDASHERDIAHVVGLVAGDDVDQVFDVLRGRRKPASTAADEHRPEPGHGIACERGEVLRCKEPHAVTIDARHERVRAKVAGGLSRRAGGARGGI